MAIHKVLGSGRPVETKRTKEVRDRETAVIEVEGSFADIELADPRRYCPSGMEVESSNVTTTGDGMGKLTVRCIKYDSALSSSAIRTTFHIGMEAVTYDLEDHPYLTSVRGTIIKWLATEDSKRYDPSSHNYKYENENGILVTISNARAIEFCRSYMDSSITTFNRYFPVISKISIWRSPPGLIRNGRSFTSGTPTFSSGIGGFDNPPITLSGYGAQHWFKSHDEWQENADKTWTRTEQWTYTPESSTGTNAWIYNELEA